MPKAKAPADLANGQQLDPVIDALLEHLPAPGDYWGKEDRKRWLEIMELAFDLIYDDAPEQADTMLTHGG